jgi:predicted acyl esterase
LPLKHSTLKSEHGNAVTNGYLRLRNRRDQNADNEANQFTDDEYYSTRDFQLENIEVPLLSVANWGGINLHLRGNIHGFLWAGSKQKWLRCIVGRHDLPFYYPEEVSVQKSFLDCFLRDDDHGGWLSGQVPRVDLCLRKGDVGWNNAARERLFPRRAEYEWPIARTNYTKHWLQRNGSLSTVQDESMAAKPTTLSYKAMGNISNPRFIQFSTAPFTTETEITGHPIVHLHVSMQPDSSGISKDPVTSLPEKHDIDIFVTLRHISAQGKEVFYTGSSGDNMPVVKGWLRVSLRKTNADHPRHHEYLPYREYRSTDVEMIRPGTVYAVDIEMWPTNVVVEEGARLVLEVASGDTQGCGVFKHDSDVDR